MFNEILMAKIAEQLTANGQANPFLPGGTQMQGIPPVMQGPPVQNQVLPNPIPAGGGFPMSLPPGLMLALQNWQGGNGGGAAPTYAGMAQQSQISAPSGQGGANPGQPATVRQQQQPGYDNFRPVGQVN